MTDPHDLQRFVDAQADTYAQALTELQQGRKSSHWMWFVFPQLVGLGSSPTAQRYAVDGLAQARAYLAHPVLGPRLREATDVVAATTGRTAEQLLGGVDALKLRSSITLFLRAAPDEPRWQQVLDAFYGGEPDTRTDRLLPS